MVVRWGSISLVKERRHPINAAAQVYFLRCFFVGFGNLLARLVGRHPEDDPTVLVHKLREFVSPETPFQRASFADTYARLHGSNSAESGNLILAIDTKQLSIPQLPKNLSGLRIVHISDLHLTGRIGPEWFNFVADQGESPFTGCHRHYR